MKLGRVGQISPIVTLFHSESYVPTRLGFSTSSVSVGLFSFDPFGKTARKYHEQNLTNNYCCARSNSLFLALLVDIRVRLNNYI